MIRSPYIFWLALFFIAVPVAAGQEHNHDKAQATASAPPPLFKDLGTLHHPITTSSPQAQQYFDQGLRLIYAFNHDEATRSFQEAVRLDPNCAMAYWGIAHAVGPNYNLALDPEREKTATEAIQKALSLTAKVSEAERAYIEALAKRFPTPPGGDRKALDTAYADAMREVARRYPDDLDAATLFAESIMVLRPWDLWTLDGQPHPGTPEIISTLEVVLQKNPNHPGAMHYYIHAVEPSPSPERAVPYAERLAQLTPGAGHLVHMPSHIFMRVGRYREAAANNAQAVKVDESYIAKYNIQGIYAMMYYPHNIHFLWAAVAMEGRRADSLRAARTLVAKAPWEMVRQMPPMEYFAPTLLFTLARFGEWKTILKEPAPPVEFQYTTGVWHYVRGLAFVATNRLDEAVAEQTQVKDLAATIPPDRTIGDNTPAAVLLQIAANILAGKIAARRGQLDDAVRSLEEAVRLQDTLPYTEPPPWYYPVRQSLGAVLLTAGRATEAEAVYREDLKRNPENGWSLYGLTQSLKAQKKTEDAAAVEKRFRKAWMRADVKLSAARF